MGYRLRYGIGITSVVFGVLLVAVGFVALLYLPVAIEQGVEEQVVVDSPSASMFSSWETNGGDNPPVMDHYYFYNMTNPDEVLQGAMPNLTEVGPYVYRKVSTKLKPEFMREGEEVSYYLRNQWFFEPDLSVGSPDDVFTNINPAYLGVLYQIGSEAVMTVAMSCPQMKEIIITTLAGQFSTRVESHVLPSLLDVAYSTLLASAHSVGGNADVLLATWANATMPPVGDTPSQWNGMLVSRDSKTPSAITLESARLLFSQDEYALTNTQETTTAMWWWAAQKNATSIAFLQNRFSLSDDAMANLLSYYSGEATSMKAVPYLVSTFSLDPQSTVIQARQSLAFMQFATAQVSDVIFSQPTVGMIYGMNETFIAPPEYGAWYATDFHGKVPQGEFDTAAMMHVLAGPKGIFNPKNLILMLAASANATEEEIEWGITQPQEEMLLVYLTTYLVPTFVTKQFLPNIFAAGGGFINTRSVDTILFTGTDPLVAQLAGPDNAQSNMLINTTSEDMVYDTQARNSVLTGKNDIPNLGNFTQFNGSNMLLSEWSVPHAVFGTAGDSFPPGDHDTVTVFAEDLARELFFEKHGTEVVEGITLNQYVLIESQFDIDPSWDMYSVRGFMNLTRQQNTPMFICLPHFLHAMDDWTTGKLVGISPGTEAAHETILSVEPITGATMHARKRLQFNMYLPPNSGWFNAYNTKVLQGQMYPLLWLDEQGIISADLADEFKSKVYGTKQLGVILTYVGLVAGGVLLLAGAALLFHTRRSRKTMELQVIPPHEVEPLILSSAHV